ncbi:MAG: SMP-30/gluconolactonase/LRE family protein [Nitrososphaerales archaeon]
MSESGAELILDARAEIGEGPSWDGRKKVLYWVDIPKGEVHVYDPRRRVDRAIPVGRFVSSVVPREDGEDLMVTMQHGFYRLEPATGGVTKVCGVELGKPGNRFNDGKCDPMGRFWAGTMATNEKDPTGALYRLDGSRAVKAVPGVTISNGLGWSPDGSVMYYIDTPTRKVSAFDYDVETGSVSRRRTVVDFGGEAGDPDGLAVDEEGMLWVAHWGGGKVSRWDARTGRKVGQLAIPAPNVTSCCFGGRKLDELYVTSAAVSASSQHPAAGGLFRARCAVRGLPTNAFRP